MTKTTLLLFSAIGLGLASATSNTACTCGQKKHEMRSGVINGKDADINEYPWMVWIHGCGAVLINSRWVLTAKHCSKHDKYIVTMGEHDVKHGHDDGETTKDFDVVDIVQHPDVDLALMKVKGDIDISTYTPICLPNPGLDFRGKNITLTGWGSQCHEEDPLQGPCPPVTNWILQEADMPVPQSDEECRNTNDDYICFGGNGKSGCYGDSGSPIIYNNDGKWTLVGITHGPSPGSVDCGIGPGDFGIAAKVSKYMDWIEKTAVGGSTCEN